MAKQIAKVAVVDVDSIGYHVAAASEKASIEVVNNTTNEIHEFKNRTEFYGRGKRIGGWLGELNNNLPEDKQLTKESFTLRDVYVPDPIEYCLSSLKKKLESLRVRGKEILGTTHTHLVMGGGQTFRHGLLLPSQYKANRNDLHRPILLEQTREYLVNYQNAELVTGIEADDRIAMYGFKGWRDFRKTGVFSYAQFVEDKDSHQVNSVILNPRKEGGKWVYDKPIIVDGLGSLYFDDKGKLMGTGFSFLMFQTFGDKVDGFSATQPFGIKFGDKGKFNLLKDCVTPEDYLKKVVWQYREWFGDMIEYIAWEGTHIKVPVIDYIDMMFTCCYMLRWRGDKTSFSGLCLKYGVKY